MNTIDNVRKGLLVAALSLGLGSAALPALAQTAQPAAAAAKAEPGRFGHAVSKEERQARRAEHFAKRQAALHDALKLSSAQESAWTTFVNATRPVPRERGERGEWASLSAPARLEKHLAFARERTARMEARLAALNSFYGVLTPEQRKTFDEANAKLGRHGHGRHHGHHGQHGERAQG